jgi:hypothetical protein
MTRRLRLAPLALLPLALQLACASGPQARPGGDEGMLLFTVGRLSFQAPAAWQARGDANHVVLVSPAGDARLDARRADRTFPDDRQCLSNAEEALARGGARLRNVRRHPTTLAGRRAVVQEADQDRWHGWAWALCDAGEQYRVFLTGLSPVREEALRAVRLLSSSAYLAGPGSSAAPAAAPALARGGGTAR